MSVQPDPTAQRPQDELQFDHAEFDGAPDEVESKGVLCSACRERTHDVYYEANGNLFCPACRDKLEHALTGGSRVLRVVKASFLGGVAAAIGAALYYAITRATGYNIGLVSVLLGILVGTLVKQGSDGRGGWFYQLLALFLTYSAIVAMHVPIVVEAVRAQMQAEEKEDQAAADVPKAEEKAEAAKADGEPEKKAEPAAVAAGAEPEDEPASARDIALALLTLLGFVYAIPILVVTQDPISGLIFGFAMWEAWKLNRRTRVAINGPFHVGEGSLHAV